MLSFSKKNSSKHQRNPIHDRRLQFESLENRELLSVNPLSPDASALVCECAPVVFNKKSDVQEAPTSEAPPYAYVDTFTLHSKADSNFTIYLDFNGHTTTGTSWNSGSRTTITTPAFSLDSDPAFSNTELERIQYIWQRVAEDFAPFDIDVTTQEPTLDRLIKSGTGDTAWGVRVAIGGSCYDWYSEKGSNGAGGVAVLRSFNSDIDTPCFIFSQNLGSGDEKDIAEAISHEVGHTLGLSHDGTSSAEYYSGNEVWAPIMGTGYTSPLVQWSKGEYPDANNPQDDLNIITTSNGFSYRADDHGNSKETATALSASGSHFIGSGIVERNTDVDFFSFTVSSSSTASIVLKSGGRDANLDILAKLYTSTGSLIVSSNPLTSLNAEFFEFLGAGTYYISVEGTGRDGYYSDYGSIGTYSIDLEFVTPTGDVGDTMASAQTITFSNNAYRITEEIGNGNYTTKDVDMYKLVVGVGDLGRTFVFKTSLPPGCTSEEGVDTYLRLFNSSGTLISYNDDGNSGNYSLLEFAPTVEGTYYVGVSSFGNRAYNPSTYGSGPGGTTGLYTLEVNRTAGREVASTVVTTDSDDVDAFDGVTSFREAINHAGTNGLGTEITFAQGMKGKTIYLDTGNYNYWSITKDLTIDAGGMNITLDANGGWDSVYNYRCISNTATTTIIGLTVTGLTRDQSIYNCGGGFYNTGNLTLIDCQAVGNTTIGVNNRNTMTVINTLVAGNRGYGVYVDNIGTPNYAGIASLTIINSTILDNFGADWSQIGSSIDLTINNSIVDRLYLYDTYYRTVRINNSLVSRYAVSGDSGFVTLNASLTGGYYSNPLDPKFVNYTAVAYANWTTDAWKSWDLRLQVTSPAVNAGNTALIPSGITKDFAGNNRVAGTAVDMGAYEYGSTTGLDVPEVTATGVAGGVKLTWDAIAGADRYGVWRLAANGKGWVEFGYVTGTTYTDTTGRVGVAETYAVRAFQGTEKSSYHAVKGTALLGVPQVTATGVAGGVKLSWDAVNGADRYFAWRRNATNTAWIELGSFTGTTFTDTAARVGVAETYAVRAYLGTKESSYVAVKGTALLGVPQVTATGVAGGVKLSWDAVNGADRYFAWRRNATNTAWVELGSFTGTTLTDTAARVGVAETYAVRAYQGTKESSYVAVKGTALPATLGVPQVTATGVVGGVKLTWDAIDGADRYFAWRRNATNTAWIELGSFTGTTLTDTGARVGVAETYAVRAYQGTKESSYVAVKGTALDATLGVPQVTTTGVSGGVKLSWDAIAGADRYVAWRRNATNTAWIELGTFTETTFTDTTGRANVAETYAVRAYQGSKESSYVTVKGTALLGVPQVTTTGVSGGVKLSWDAINGADRYVAWRRNATNTAWIELGTFTGTTFTDTAARVGVAETYAVRAYQGTKESSYITVKGTALLGVPQVTATGVSGGVLLTWTAIAGADRYGVWRQSADGKGWIEFGYVTGTAYFDNTGRVGVAETYAVRAFMGTEKSSYHAVKGTSLGVANIFALDDAEIDSLFLLPIA